MLVLLRGKRVESAREVFGSVRVGGKSPKNDKVKAVIKRKVLGARDEDAKERCVEAYKGEKREVKKKYIYKYQSLKEVNEQFERKMNQDVNENCLGRRFIRQMDKGWRVAPQ